MRKYSFTIVLAVALLAIGSSHALAAPGEEAANAYSEGHELLAKADFIGALRAFATAAMTDPSKPEYQQKFALLKQVIDMQKAIAEVKCDVEWEKTARGLRKFYYDNKVFTEALALDRRFHSKFKSLETATMLAQTEISLGMNAEAEAILSGICDDHRPTAGTVLLGIALARQQKLDEAAATAAKIDPEDPLDAGIMFDIGRLHALIGKPRVSLAYLTRSLESTPPSEIELVRAGAMACADFSSIAKTPAFAAVLKTASKIAQSSCSGGSGCGGCNMKDAEGCSMKSGGGGCNMKGGSSGGGGSETGSCNHEKK